LVLNIIALCGYRLLERCRKEEPEEDDAHNADGPIFRNSERRLSIPLKSIEPIQMRQLNQHSYNKLEESEDEAK